MGSVRCFVTGSGKKEDYQGSEEAEVHWEEKYPRLSVQMCVA